MRTFVMGDIHGAHKALCQCLELAAFDKQRDELIQLGDIADGYIAEIAECVDELLAIENLVAIKGNHDEWFNQYILTGYHPDRWAQGGAATAKSYLRRAQKKPAMLPSSAGYKTALNPGDIPDTHQRFFQSQHLHHIDKRGNCYVHGGFDRTRPFKGQEPQIYYWDRTLWLAALSFEAGARGKGGGKFGITSEFNKIFIGHTSTTNWKTDKPMQAANILNLDTGAGSGGRLTIMDVDSAQIWQSDTIRSLYP